MTAEDDQQRESRRIIGRMNAETDGAAMGVVRRSARRGRDHFAAADADENDWVELWGTRIGRAISLTLFLALVIYLGSILLGR
jgi:hypothetical protein